MASSGGNAHVTALIALVASMSIGSPARAAPRGLWLLQRKDACNTARADIAGDMRTAPKEVWSYGSVRPAYAYLLPVALSGKDAFFAQVRAGVRLIRADGAIVWDRPRMGVGTTVGLITFGGSARPAALVTLGDAGFALLDVATGKTMWTWYAPAGSHLAGYRLVQEGRLAHVVVFPQNSMLGFCFELSASRPVPRLLWEKDFTGRYYQNFGPYFVLADMDHDRKLEIVLASKPGYVGVINLDTGDVKFDLKYEVAGGDHIGRPYGLICARDVDGDGYPDVVVVGSQVEHYIAVLKNNAGKSLGLAWSQYVAYDLPTAEKELEPNVTSLADVNGDGRPELALGFYNPHGDKRWHTIVFDTMKGFVARLADLPDRYFWGCYDLNGDGIPEVIASAAKGHDFALPAPLEAVDGRTFHDIAAVDRASFTFMHSKLALDTEFSAARSTPLYVTTPRGAQGLVISRNGGEVIWRIAGGKSSFAPFALTPVSRLVLFSEGVGSLTRARLATGAVLQPRGPGASWPLVSFANGKRELILALSNGRIIGGAPDLAHPGEFAHSWSVRGSMPSVRIGAGGKRILCAADPSADAVALYAPAVGERLSPPLARFGTPYRITRPYTAQGTAELLPFGDKELRLFVAMHRGIHPTASAVYDISGRVVWADPENGPHPRAAAAADLDGDGNDEVFLDNHGKQIIYDSRGQGRMIAQGWYDTIPGRGNGAKYVLPIIGPFGPNGETRIINSPGLDALEVLDAAGARLAKKDFASTYEFDCTAAAVARIRDAAHWDVGMVDKEGLFYCADVNTCQYRWTLDLGVKATSPVSVTSGDLDGDGRDNFLVGLPNGDLVALDEKDGKGFVLWTLPFDAGVNGAFLADVDGDGVGEVVVELDDGRVKLLKSRPEYPRRRG